MAVKKVELDQRLAYIEEHSRFPIFEIQVEVQALNALVTFHGDDEMHIRLERFRLDEDLSGARLIEALEKRWGKEIVKSI